MAGACVARLIELVVQPRVLEHLGIRVSSVPPVRTRRERVEHRFCREHSRLHRGVAAFDLQHVQEAGVVADQQCAGYDQFR